MEAGEQRINLNVCFHLWQTAGSITRGFAFFLLTFKIVSQKSARGNVTKQTPTSLALVAHQHLALNAS